MADKPAFDVIMVGGGVMGCATAYYLLKKDPQIKVAIIEKAPSELGGTCSNWGCIPTKALVKSAHLLEEIHDIAPELGITVGNLDFDFAGAVDRKNKVVSELRQGIEGLLNVRKIPIHYCAGERKSNRGNPF